MQFNITQIIPNPIIHHGLNGYLEVIETLRWGLTELGHDVTCSTNAITPDRINVVFGSQMLTEPATAALPANTIIYNLEQIASVPLDQLKAVAKFAAKFQIWDYSLRNADTWRKLNPPFDPIVVPIGYSPTLKRIPADVDRDIDILIYGQAFNNRLAILQQLAGAGAKAMFVCGLYGKARDELIARSKIVVNINGYAQSRVFEIVRVSYLLANGRCVVSDEYPESAIDPDIRQAVAFAPLEQLSALCLQLLSDEPARKRLETQGPLVMQSRDIRPILQRALKL